MNMVGNLGGSLSSVVIAYILNHTHNDWDMVLYVRAGVYFAGLFFWLMLDPVTPLESKAA